MQSNLSSLLLRYEEGELDNDEIVDLFTQLVDNGMAWSLPGRYGRVARDLILANKIPAPDGVKRALRM